MPHQLLRHAAPRPTSIRPVTRRPVAALWQCRRVHLRPRFVHYSLVRRAKLLRIGRLLLVKYVLPEDRVSRARASLASRFNSFSRSPEASLSDFYAAGGSRSKYRIYMDRCFFLQHFFYVLPNLRRLPKAVVRSRASAVQSEFCRQRCYIYRGRRFKAIRPSR